MTKTTERLTKEQARYKKHYDASLRNQSEEIHFDDYMYLQIKRKNPNECRYKLAPIAEGPQKVTKVDNRTFFIEKTDQSVGKVSCSRVVLALKPQSEKEVETILKPTTSNYKDTEYSIGEDANMKDIADDTGKEKAEHDPEEVTTKESRSEKEEPKNNEKPDNENPDNHNEEKVTHERNKIVDSTDKGEDPTDDVVIEKSIDHKIN